MLQKAFPWFRHKPASRVIGRLVIRGERAVIREKRLQDAAADFGWRTDEEMARLDATRPITMSFEEFLRYSKEELSYASSHSRRLAIDTLDGRHIGNCMYYDIDTKRGQAELGIMIDRKYWGQGYGTDSVDALLTHIFTTTSLQRVYLHTLDWNERARRSFAKSGFSEVGNVHRGGLDFVRMEIDRPDWEGLRQREAGAASTDHHLHHGGVSSTDDGASPQDAQR